MDIVCLESQSVNQIDMSKAVRPSCLFIAVNFLVGLRKFKDRSLPKRARFQANLEGVRINIQTMCVGIYKMSGGGLDT